MAAALVPDALWSLLRPLPQLQCRSRKVDDHVYPIELASQAFCSYYEVAFPGGCCRNNWVAVLE
jgi:hypothetical protein